MKQLLTLFTAAVCGSTLPAQISWAPTNLAGPAPRENHSLAWCPVTQQVLGFGGDSFALGFVNDTTTWNGQSWATLTPAGAVPSGRGGHVLSTDLLRRRIVLFGGINQGGSCNDETWEWNGSQWLQQTPATRPSARSLGAMAYGLGATYMFGGTPNGNSAGPHHTETWRWNGLTWTQLAATGPTAGLGPAMVFDPVSGRFVLFGGNVSGPSGTEVNDTWLFDGATWTQDMRTPRPPARRYHQLTYDAGNEVVVLHGGIATASQVFSDTWTYKVDGGWVQAITPSMPARFVFGMAHDPIRDQLVIFGGNDLVAPFRGDSWVAPGASAIPFGAGCANGSIAPTLTATAPVYTSTMSVTSGGGVPNGVSLLVLGFGNTCLGGQPLPFRLN
ncbi:MAG: kelch repeat-containing protein, partial [Planctomycetota bacterium]